MRCLVCAIKENSGYYNAKPTSLITVQCNVLNGYQTKGLALIDEIILKKGISHLLRTITDNKKDTSHSEVYWTLSLVFFVTYSKLVIRFSFKIHI